MRQTFRVATPVVNLRHDVTPAHAWTTDAKILPRSITIGASRKHRAGLDEQDGTIRVKLTAFALSSAC